jgi:hypothetical protein
MRCDRAETQGSIVDENIDRQPGSSGEVARAGVVRQYPIAGTGLISGQAQQDHAC